MLMMFQLVLDSEAFSIWDLLLLRRYVYGLICECQGFFENIAESPTIPVVVVILSGILGRFNDSFSSPT